MTTMRSLEGSLTVVVSAALLAAWAGCAPPDSRTPGMMQDGGSNPGTGGSGGGGGSSNQGGTSGGGNRDGSVGGLDGRAGSGGGGSSGAGGGSGGAGGGPPTGADAGPDRAVVGIADGGQVCGMQTTEIPYTPSTPDVIIAFDDSKSMTASFGGGTRYTTVRDLLKPLIMRHQDRVHWGFERFPSTTGTCMRNGGAMGGCCAESVCIGPKPMNAGAVNAAIDRNGPQCDAGPGPPPAPACMPGGMMGCPGQMATGGGTPTAVALWTVRDFYANLNDGIKDRYVLLSTDGNPNCNLNSTGGATSCDDTVSEITKLAAMGVKTVVLGVSEEVRDSACLERMAIAGQARKPAPGPAFYPAADRAALEMFLDQIISGFAKPACKIDLTAPPTDTSRVAVFFNNKQVPWDPMHVNGWDFEAGSNTRIIIYGSYCTEVETFKVMAIDVRFGCPPCGGTVSCP